MGKRLAIVGLVWSALAACSSSSRCEKLIEQGTAECIKLNTQIIYIDGKPTQQLMSNEEARKQCGENRGKRVAKCEKWPADVLECAEKQYSAPDEWKLPRCQAILEANYEKSKNE
jgi:hypothetical protein